MTNKISKMRISARRAILLALAGVALAAGGATAADRPAGVWSEAAAATWADSQPWALGCNYMPRTAVNTLEMWQAGTFDPAAIDQELGWAEGLGLNAVRVFLHHLPWEQDPKGFLGRLETFLAIADRHHIGTMFVLFDDCWNPNAALGPQPAPRPGVHNSGWVQCPGPELLVDTAGWPRLEAYLKGVIGALKDDRRVLAWDLYNEPGNSDYGPRSLPLLRRVFAWAREVAPRQPLTAAVWDTGETFAGLNRFQLDNSDIVTFHAYTDRAGTKKVLEPLKSRNRPVICTEYMVRAGGGDLEEILPLLRSENIGAMNWGLVSGKTQTIFPWGSKEGSAEPAVWFHDLLRPDGSPFRASEAALLRRMAGRPEAGGGAAPAAVHPVRPFHAWAPAPPLGWNSWDSFGQAVTEAEVKANAEFMARKLAPLGWSYIVVDIEWYEPQRLGPDYPVRSMSEVDGFGRFVPSPEKFPSSAGGLGFRPLADFVHAKGLKFGLHIVRGIPRLAVERNTPIEGSPYRAADIVDRKDFCPWNPDQWGVDVRRPGAQEWYDSLFRMFASWGVDFVKADDLCYRGAEIAVLRRAIDRSGRPMVLSVSYGPMPLDKAGELAANANMWRLLGDLWDYWDQVLPAFRQLHDWAPHAGPGHWPDPDMLPLGRLRFLPAGWSRNATCDPGYFRMASHGGREDVPNFLGPDEQRTVMTLWSIARCPMMFGGHLPASDEATLALITNPEVLAVNQKGASAHQVFRANGLAAWASAADDRRSAYLAVFNTNDPTRGAGAGLEVPVRLSDLGLSGPCAVRDLWARAGAGRAEGEFTPVVPFHGAGLYKLTPASKRK